MFYLTQTNRSIFNVPIWHLRGLGAREGATCVSDHVFSLPAVFWLGLLINKSINLCKTLPQTLSKVFHERAQKIRAIKLTNRYRDPRSDTHKVFNVKIEISSQHPKEWKESYLDRRRPSISNFFQFISRLKSKRTMMSGINQMLTPHIQDRDSRPFLPAQICLLSRWRSLAADSNPSLVACASIRQLEDCAGATRAEQNVGKCRDNTGKIQRAAC